MVVLATKQESSYPTKGFGRLANFEEVMTAYGSWLDRQGVRTTVRASSPKAMEVEEYVGAIRRLPATWNNPSRWHTVIEGNFKFKEAIHMKEGRAALMGLRRAVAGTAGHGHRILSLTDNMSSLLAFDRGRSCSYDLLCLCRRAAALCIGADVSWVLRHLETWHNPSDEGSRRVPGSGPQCFRLVSALSQQIPQNLLRLAFAAPALSVSFVMVTRGPLLNFDGAVPMSSLAAIYTLPSLTPEWISAVLLLISSGRNWYLHVEPGIHGRSSQVSVCLRHRVLFTLKVSLPCKCSLLDRAPAVLRPVASFSHPESEKKGSG